MVRRASPGFRVVLVALPLAGLLFAVMANGSDDSAKPAADAPKAPAVAGSELCMACHSDVATAQQDDWHSRAVASRPGSSNCEECHGPSAAHTGDPANVRTFYDVKHAPAGRSAQACLSCHQRVGRNAALWKASEHAQANVRCWGCHSQGATPHNRTIRRPDKTVCYTCHRDEQAKFEMTSHHPVNEGRVDCSDCHDPHARQSDRAKTDICASCHAEQRGPFVFAHGAISGELTDGCLDCHQAHGSPNQRLLRYTGRGLCLQCHADHALHFLPRTCWSAGCHSQVHGSNTSPLLFGS